MDYASTLAMVNAKRSLMLSRRHYQQLLKTSSINETFEILKTTEYDELVRKIRPSSDQVTQFEHLAFSHYYASALKLLRACPGKPFFKILRQKIELTTLKALLSILNDESQGQRSTFFFPIGRYTAEKCRSILASRNAVMAIRSVDDQVLRGKLMEQVREYEKNGSISAFLATIDTYCYSKLWRTASYLGSMDSTATKRVLGAEIEILNILTVLRMKKLGLEQSKILGLIVPVQYRLSLTTLESAAKADTLQQSIKLLSANPYSHVLFSGLTGKDVLSGVEGLMRRALARKHILAFSGFQFYAGAILAYLWLAHQQILDVSGIVNGKIAGLSPERIGEQLVMFHVLA